MTAMLKTEGSSRIGNFRTLVEGTEGFARLTGGSIIGGITGGIG